MNRICLKQTTVPTMSAMAATNWPVTNTGTSTAELPETACALTTAVAAVAVWPTPRLAPGELAEIYVVRRQLPPAERTQPRPSLIR